MDEREAKLWMSLVRERMETKIIKDKTAEMRSMIKFYEEGIEEYLVACRMLEAENKWYTREVARSEAAVEWYTKEVASDEAEVEWYTREVARAKAENKRLRAKLDGSRRTSPPPPPPPPRAGGGGGRRRRQAGRGAGAS